MSLSGSPASTIVALEGVVLFSYCLSAGLHLVMHLDFGHRLDCFCISNDCMSTAGSHFLNLNSDRERTLILPEKSNLCGAM